MSLRSLLITEVTVEALVKTNVDGIATTAWQPVENGTGVMVSIQETIGSSGGVRTVRGAEGTEYDAILFAESNAPLQPSGTTQNESQRYRVTVTGGRGIPIGTRYMVLLAGFAAGRGHHIEATLKRLPAEQGA